MNGNLSQAKLNVLAQICVNNLEKLFKELQVDLEVSGNKYIGCCPIHGDADNTQGFNLYYDGYSVPGFWKCRTKNCQDKFGKNILGFVRGRLSVLRLGYHRDRKPDAIYGFPDTIKFLCNFLKVDVNKIEVDETKEERRQFMLECIKDQHKYVYDQKTIPREKVRSSLILKPQYFLDRGFSEATLDYFDIGVAKKPKPENLNRIIVPLYVEQDKKQFLAGYTCRSVFEKCPNCKLFHPQDGEVKQESICVSNCPTSEAEKALLSKWRHVGFSPEYYLYNYWNAHTTIKETNVCILVEGPGDVWKLHQAGIRNAVGLFGNTLYDGQEKLLATAQCMSMIIMMDNDHAGLEGARAIKKKYGRLYRMYFPTLSGHDAGDMNEDSITASIKPILDKIK